MTPPEPSPFAQVLKSPRLPLVAAALLVGLALLAWSGSFGGPFVVDDMTAIVSNVSIRDLGALGDVLSPPPNTGTGGRPVLNLTYAVNYFIDRLKVSGYHGFNLAIHAAAALALFGLVRRTLLLPSLRARFGEHALLLAFTIAALWTLHPVQTASITYISQRAEALMGVFYFFTLYAFVRAAEHRPASDFDPSAPKTADDADDAEARSSARARFALPSLSGLPRGYIVWCVLAVLSCLLGVGVKEPIATAPLMVLLFDRTFAAGSFLGALRARPRLYVALALTWIPLAVMMADVTMRGIGTGHGMDRLTYLYTQARGLWHYLAVALWPQPLVFGYEAEIVRTVDRAALFALPLLLALAGTIFALVRFPRAGFVAAWFFILLAPTSSFIPVAFSPVADSRLYLPLAGLVTGAVLLVHAGFGRRALAGLLTVALAAGLLTYARNRVFQTSLSLWADTVAKQPDNAAARVNLADVLSRVGRNEDAITHLRRALEVDPNRASAHNNLANALVAVGRSDEAILHYRAAIHLQPEASLARANLAYVLLQAGRIEEAEEQCRLAVKQNPFNASAHLNLALIHEARGRLAQQIISLENALVINPGYFEAYYNLGLALMRADRPADAAVRFESAVRLRPTMLEAHLNFVRALLLAGRNTDARSHATYIVQQAPASADGQFLLGNALAVTGDLPAAAAAYERALALSPGAPEVIDNLNKVRAAYEAQRPGGPAPTIR